jgi:hypothetical protein
MFMAFYPRYVEEISDVAFAMAIARTAHNAKEVITSDGKFQSVRQAAARYGLKEATLHQRLRNGWTPDQAVGNKKRPKQTPKGNSKPIVCHGTSYHSRFALADAFGVNRIRTAKRLRSGWTPKQAVGLEKPPPRFRDSGGAVRDHAWTSKQVTLDGKAVPKTKVGFYRLYLLRDEKTGQEYIGITTNNLKARLRGHWGMVGRGRHSKLYNRMRKAKAEGRRADYTITQIRNDAKDFIELQTHEYEEIQRRDTVNNGLNTAAGGSLGTSSSIEVDGELFPSQQAAADYYGVEAYNFNQRINKLGWTPEEAAGLSPDKQYGQEIVVRGNKFDSIRSACNHYQIKYGTVWQRLKLGWSIEAAFGFETAPLKKVHNAKVLNSSIGMFTSIAEASSETGIGHSTISQRLRLGWSVDEALEVVPRSKG